MQKFFVVVLISLTSVACYGTEIPRESHLTDEIVWLDEEDLSKFGITISLIEVEHELEDSRSAHLVEVATLDSSTFLKYGIDVAILIMNRDGSVAATSYRKSLDVGDLFLIQPAYYLRFTFTARKDYSNIEAGVTYLIDIAK